MIIRWLFRTCWSFYAKAAPETLMQRLGAFVMGLANVLSSLLVLHWIADTWRDDWTTSGIWLGLLGVLVIVLILPLGVVHGLSALYPPIFSQRARQPLGSGHGLQQMRHDSLKFVYALIGWCTLIGVPVLIGYVWAE